MAEGFLRSFDTNLDVFSAGTQPAEKVNPFAVKVMNEVGIDLSNRRPKNVSEFLNQSFDYVITVCDNAKETCPVFVGQVKHRVHLGFEDPAEARGTDDELTVALTRVRDEIRKVLGQFYSQTMK
jgi:arsenate reductase